MLSLRSRYLFAQRDLHLLRSGAAQNQLSLNKVQVLHVIFNRASMKVSLSEIESVYRSRGADFFRLALARTGEVDAARDAVQEGFAKAIRARRSYRGTGPVEAWVARCVINAAHDLARRERNVTAEGTDAQVDLSRVEAAEAASSSDADVEVVRGAVAQLPQRQRDVLYLRFYLDFDYATIAEALGVEVGTVSASLHAARASLAENLQEVAR